MWSVSQQFISAASIAVTVKPCSVLALGVLLERALYTRCDNIRMPHECEGEIEKFVPWITDWHHEACLLSDDKR